MHTYINKQGKIMIRSCANCTFFSLIDKNGDTGYCHKMPLVFAPTGEQTVYGIVKLFYRCPDKHQFFNEDFLKQNAVKVDSDEILK